MARRKHLIAAVAGCGMLGLAGLAEAGRKKKAVPWSLSPEARSSQASDALLTSPTER